MSQRFANLSTYLGTARAARSSPGRVVIGNEAADLDSMVSAIHYGLLASARSGAEEPIVLPVINCLRDDFGLRTEAVFLLGEHGISPQQLTFIDDVDLDRAHRADRLRLTLVDHNVLAAGQALYATAVEAIVDHHRDGGRYEAAAPRIIEPVGSAATLVAEAMLASAPDLVVEQTASLLLGTILLDTVNLNPVAGRVTPKDKAVADALNVVANLDTEALYAQLQTEKFNVSALDTRDLLRKDYKSWDSRAGRYGMSTVLTSTESWAARDPRLVDGLESFLRSRDLVCLVAMMAYSEQDAFKRELGIVLRDSATAARFTEALQAADIGLTGIPLDGEDGRVAFFAQRDKSCSRKKLQPLVQAFFDSARDD